MLRPAKDKNVPDPTRLKTLPTPSIRPFLAILSHFLAKVLQTFDSSS